LPLAWYAVADGLSELLDVNALVCQLGALFALDHDGLPGSLDGDGHDLGLCLVQGCVKLLLGVQGYACALPEEDLALEVI